MAIISIGTYDKVSVFALYCVILIVVKNYMYKIWQLKVGPMPLTATFIDGFSQTFAIFIELKIRAEKVHNYSGIDPKIYNNDLIFLMKSASNREEERTVIHKMKLFFLGGLVISIFRIMGSLCTNFMRFKYEKNALIILCLAKFVEFTSNSLLGNFFLKIPAYRHQILSLIIIGLVTSGMFIYSKAYEIEFDAFFTLTYIFFSISQVMQRYFMHNRFVSAYVLLFLNGIFMGGLLVIIGVLIGIFEHFELIPSFLEFFKSIFIPEDELEKLKDWKFIFASIFSLGLSLFYNLFAFLIIKFLGPTFWSANYYISYLVIYAIDYFSGINDVQPSIFWITFSGYLIMLFCSLIYHEFIILNFCDLDLYTSNIIKQRGIYESRLLEKEGISLAEQGKLINEE